MASSLALASAAALAAASNPDMSMLALAPPALAEMCPPSTFTLDEAPDGPTEADPPIEDDPVPQPPVLTLLLIEDEDEEELLEEDDHEEDDPEFHDELPEFHELLPEDDPHGSEFTLEEAEMLPPFVLMLADPPIPLLPHEEDELDWFQSKSERSQAQE